MRMGAVYAEASVKQKPVKSAEGSRWGNMSGMEQPLTNAPPQTLTPAPSACPEDGAFTPGVVAAPPATASLRRRLRVLRPASPAEWVLVAYLAVVIAITVLSWALGETVVRTVATSPDDLGPSTMWQLVASGLLADGPLAPQIVATAVLGAAAIRLTSGRAFWSVAVIGHVLGTVLVYVGVWIADVASPSLVTALTRQADFGVSLVWCAALGMLAAVAWWRLRPLQRRTWLLLAFGAPLTLAVVTALSEGLARYEHVVAFALAVGLVYAGRRWRGLGRRLRLSVDARDGAG
jgi:hypothetical protein